MDAAGLRAGGHLSPCLTWRWKPMASAWCSTLAWRRRSEPFSALDVQPRLLLQAETMAAIRDRHKTAILITRDIGEAITMADRSSS